MDGMSSDESMPLLNNGRPPRDTSTMKRFTATVCVWLKRRTWHLHLEQLKAFTVLLTCFQWVLLVLLVAATSTLIANILMIRGLHAALITTPSHSGVGRLVHDVKARRVDLTAIYTNSSVVQSYLADGSTTDITPIPCHSHNDYWRTVPLFEAIANGCTSVEADIWQDVNEATGLLVGRSSRSLRPEKTLNAMYLDPILAMLEVEGGNTSTSRNGIFSTSPNTTLVLLLDFKNPASSIWSSVQEHLAPLREKGYLRSWSETSQSVDPGALTIVATGDIDFALITNSSTNPHHDVFFDAPLNKFPQAEGTTAPYNISNSYYASSAVNAALGIKHIRPWQSLTESQKDRLRVQTRGARDLGLHVRYWATPSWPISFMTKMWQVLLEDVGVDVLNVDDLELAAKWDWTICRKGLWGIC